MDSASEAGRRSVACHQRVRAIDLPRRFDKQRRLIVMTAPRLLHMSFPARTDPQWLRDLTDILVFLKSVTSMPVRHPR